MIELYNFRPAYGLPSASPFVLKVDAYLRMTGIPFKVVIKNDPRKAPKKKLPVILDEGQEIPDSGAIIAHLKKKYGDKLDAKLTPEQHGVAHAVRRMLEESTYFAVVYARWIYPPGWEITREVFFGKMPAIVRAFLPGMIQKDIKRTLYGQGIGRHSHDEIMAMGKADIDAMVQILGDKPYLLGDEPTSIDAIGYGFVAQLMYTPFTDELITYAKTRKTLVAYTDRIRARYYPADEKAKPASEPAATAS
jgi:glutathione S-transferase